MSTLDKMIAIAATYHLGQFDKGGNPYILHPLKVMHYTHSNDPEIMMIAVGHDLLEDTDYTEQMLREDGFSERVIAGILAMTKIDGESYEDYIERILANRDAIIVKKADVRHNTDIRRLKGITPKDIARMEKYQRLYTKLDEACR